MTDPTPRPERDADPTPVERSLRDGETGSPGGTEARRRRERDRGTHTAVVSAVDEGWNAGGALIGSVLSGFLVGYLLDAWLGTDPWFVIGGILLGSYSGFLRLWHHARRKEVEHGR